MVNPEPQPAAIGSASGNDIGSTFTTAGGRSTADAAGASLSSFFHFLFGRDEEGSDAVLWPSDGDTGERGRLREGSPEETNDGCESDVAGTNVGAACLDQEPPVRATCGLCVSVILTGVGNELPECIGPDDGGGICSSVVLLLVGVGDEAAPPGGLARGKLEFSSTTPFILEVAAGGGARGMGMEILNDDMLGGGGGGV